jgi:hypothetical protein
MAASGWFSSCASIEAISPIVASRALDCSFSCCWRFSSSMRLRSEMSRMEPIQPVCLPLLSTSGASKISTGTRSPSGRWKMVSNCGVTLPARTEAKRVWYSVIASGAQ